MSLIDHRNDVLSSRVFWRLGGRGGVRIRLLMALFVFSSGCASGSSPSEPVNVSPSPSPSSGVGVASATALQNLSAVTALERASRRTTRLVAITTGGISVVTGRLSEGSQWLYWFADEMSRIHLWAASSNGQIRYRGPGVDSLRLEINDLEKALVLDSDSAVAVAMADAGRTYVDRYPNAGITPICRFRAGIPTWELRFRDFTNTGCEIILYVNGSDGTLLSRETSCLR